MRKHNLKPYNSEFNNHELQDEYKGYRSINITNDYRALYEEIKGADGTIACFSFGIKNYISDLPLNSDSPQPAWQIPVTYLSEIETCYDPLGESASQRAPTYILVSCAHRAATSSG